MAIAHGEFPNTTPAKNDDTFTDAVMAQPDIDRFEANAARNVVAINDYIKTEPVAVQPSDNESRINRILNSPVTKVAAIGVAGAVVLSTAIGQAQQRNAIAEQANTLSEEKATEITNYKDSIQNAIESDYDAKQSIATISVGEGGSLGEAGLEAIHEAIGDAEYNTIHNRIYSPLMDSVKQREGAVQPGEKFEVVKTDINPDAHDGDEYIVVAQNQVIHTDIDSLPAPETH